MPDKTSNQETDKLKLPAPLRSYQREGVAFLVEREAALLADQMGLGKTVQTVVALQILSVQLGWLRALVVCPASLRLNWEREIERWAPRLVVRRVEGNLNDRAMLYRLPIQVLIASYEQVRIDVRHLHPSVEFEVLVLDEAQRIKNIDSETNLACRLLPRSRVWALTGTPVENEPDDLVAIFRVLSPGLLRKGITRPEMHLRIENHFLRRRKSQVLRSLPPIQAQEVELELSGSQRAAYEEVWRSRAMLASSENGRPSRAGLLAVITRLKQLCNYDPDSGESVKFDLLQMLIEGLSEPDDKMLVFSQYVRTLEWLADRIKTPFAMFHGALTDSEKSRIVKDFNDNKGPRILLMSLKAGGIGLNLQSASLVVLYDRWWNPAIEQQAIERAHRFGRRRPLHVFKMIVTGTIEERIAEILEQKSKMFERYVESAKGAQVDDLSPIDLRRLLQLPTGDEDSTRAMSPSNR